MPHRTEDLFDGVSFRVHPLDRGDYHEWGIAYLREYAFEVDAATGSVVRHWSAGRDIPAHINSDLTISDSELIFRNGASQTIVMISLEDFACKLSPDQTLLFTANRGLNHITIYDYPANTIRLRVKMPDIQEYLPVPRNTDPRLGFHHGHLVTTDA